MHFRILSVADRLHKALWAYSGKRGGENVKQERETKREHDNSDTCVGGEKDWRQDCAVDFYPLLTAIYMHRKFYLRSRRWSVRTVVGCRWVQVWSVV